MEEEGEEGEKEEENEEEDEEKEEEQEEEGEAEKEEDTGSLVFTARQRLAAYDFRFSVELSTGSRYIQTAQSKHDLM